VAGFQFFFGRNWFIGISSLPFSGGNWGQLNSCGGSNSESEERRDERGTVDGIDV
jgi:hypothetical protein